MTKYTEEIRRDNRYHLYSPETPQEELDFSEATAEMERMVQETARNGKFENFCQFHSAWRETYKHLGANNPPSKEAVLRALDLERKISELY